MAGAEHCGSPTANKGRDGETVQIPFAISDSEVRKILNWEFSLNSARETFAEQAEGRVTLTDPRVRRLLFSSLGGGYRLKGAVLTGAGVAGLRAGRTVVLHRWPDMRFLGVVEERTAYAWRVGAVTAAALEALGTSRFNSVCLFGAGRLARTTLQALQHNFALGEVKILSRTAESREQMADEFCRGGLDAGPATDPQDAVSSADLVITMTTADEILVRHEWVDHTATVVSMGGKRELDFALLEKAGSLFVDDLDGCLESGDLARAQEAGQYRPDWVTGTLAALLADPDTYRLHGPTVFIPRGMAAMDVMQAYRAAQDIAGRDDSGAV